MDGNFIDTKRVGKDIVVSVHNPSVRDFLEDFLATSEGDVADLISSAHFYEQYVSLWKGRGDQRYSGVDVNMEGFLNKFAENCFGPSANIIRVVNHQGDPIGVHHNPFSHESRFEFVVGIDNVLNSATSGVVLARLLASLRERWTRGEADREDLGRLLASLTQDKMAKGDDAFVAAKKCLLMRREEIGDFRAIGHFTSIFPEEITSSTLEDIKRQFITFAREYSSGWQNEDPDWLRQVAADLEFVGERLKVDVTDFITPLYESADEVEQQRGNHEPDYDRDHAEFRSVYSDDVDAMFLSLRDDLSG